MAAPARIWALFADVGGWKTWNAGIDFIELHGPFVRGTTFTMRPPGQDALTSTLTDLTPDKGFTDETVVGDTRVVVRHTIMRLAPGRTRIAYSTEITGPDAAEVGEAMTSEFREVLAALKALAERQ